MVGVSVVHCRIFSSYHSTTMLPPHRERIFLSILARGDLLASTNAFVVISISIRLLPLLQLAIHSIHLVCSRHSSTKRSC